MNADLYVSIIWNYYHHLGGKLSKLGTFCLTLLDQDTVVAPLFKEGICSCEKYWPDVPYHFMGMFPLLPFKHFLNSYQGVLQT